MQKASLFFQKNIINKNTKLYVLPKFDDAIIGVRETRKKTVVVYNYWICVNIILEFFENKEYDLDGEQAEDMLNDSKDFLDNKVLFIKTLAPNY